MKLNFWQMIGVALLVAGAGLWIYRQTSQTPPVPQAAPTTAATAK